MEISARINIELAKATNYLILGNWSDQMSYKLSDAGVPVVRVPDGTSLGYSVYALNVAESTVGASPSGAGSSEWRLVESAEFIYMQAAYIERLQAALVTAEKIESLMIRTGNLEVLNGAKIAGLKVSGNSLTNEGFDNDAYIIFRNDTWKTFSGIGGNMLPSTSGLRAVARFENKNTDSYFGTVNYVLLVEATGGDRNVGSYCVGDSIVKGALLSIEPTYQGAGSENAIYDNLNRYRRFLFTPGTDQYWTVYVPTYSQIIAAFGSYSLPSGWSIEIEIAVAYNVAGAIALRGQSGAVIVNNNGDVVSHDGTYTYGHISMQKGDCVSLRYHSYNSRWQLLTHSY